MIVRYGVYCDSVLKYNWQSRICNKKITRFYLRKTEKNISLVNNNDNYQ